MLLQIRFKFLFVTSRETKLNAYLIVVFIYCFIRTFDLKVLIGLLANKKDASIEMILKLQDKIHDFNRNNNKALFSSKYPLLF